MVWLQVYKVFCNAFLDDEVEDHDNDSSILVVRASVAVAVYLNFLNRFLLLLNRLGQVPFFLAL